MTKNGESFNEKNKAGDLVRKIRFRKLEENPAKIDLRFLRKINLSDTWSGDGDCSDGLRYYAILYGNQIVWEWYKWFDDGAGRDSAYTGSEFMSRMFEVSRAYRALAKIVRRMYFREKLSSKLSRQQKREADTVYVSSETMTILVAHPQFKEFLRDFGLKLVKKSDDFATYRVKISKHYRA